MHGGRTIDSARPALPQLLAQIQATDDVQIPIAILVAQIGQHAVAFAHHHQQTTPARVVFLMRAHVIVQFVDARSQQRYLDLRRTRVAGLGVKKLLNKEGNFCVILPFKEGLLFRDKAMGAGLYYHRLVRVKTKMEKCEKRVIMCFGFENTRMEEEEIIIHENDQSFTEVYKELTRDYYPAF